MNKKIKSFEDACASLGIDPVVPDFSSAPAKQRKGLEAHYKLIIIAQAIHEGWEPNWNDSNQYKYYPWFEVEASEDNTAGFGFSRSDFGFCYSRTIVSSRLCFPTRELALYVGEQFRHLYKEYLLIEK